MTEEMVSTYSENIWHNLFSFLFFTSFFTYRDIFTLNPQIHNMHISVQHYTYLVFKNHCLCTLQFIYHINQ
jgi:hypothetical protein